MNRIVMAGLLVVLLNGCATKQYPQAAAVTPEETATLDCKMLAQEIINVHGVQSEIDQTGRFDLLTVMGMVGDFGLGNGIARYRASHNVDA